jgi:hypothetical protein
VNRAAKNHLIFASGSGTTELTCLQQQQTPVYCYGYFPSHIYKQDSYKYIYILYWVVGLFCTAFLLCGCWGAGKVLEGWLDNSQTLLIRRHAIEGKAPVAHSL